MARFNVYVNPDHETVSVIPYLLDVQADLLGALPSVVVIPLAEMTAIEQRPIRRLNPQFEIEQRIVVALVQDLASVPRRLLKTSVTNLSPQRDEILTALDFLFSGF